MKDEAENMTYKRQGFKVGVNNKYQTLDYIKGLEFAMSGKIQMGNSRNSKLALKKGYAVLNAEQARQIARNWLIHMKLNNSIAFGLPEIDDRTHTWRIPLKHNEKGKLGEIVVDAKTSLIDGKKTTKCEVIEARLLSRDLKENVISSSKTQMQEKRLLSCVRNTIACGDSEEVLQDLPADSIDLIFTSPPYFSAKPEYAEYISYEEYLLKIRKIIQQVYRVLKEGRFFVINVSPVLIRRSNRNESSQRYAVPFDLHRIFTEEGYEFIDDIVWVKPEGAGWALGRGRRFAADRQPLQYKPVVVTEYVLVYRKKTEKLIDWNIRSYPDAVIKESLITGPYEKTNVWQIMPAHNSIHPAVFPQELAERVIQYYSFKNDIILDPFAGIGTVGMAAIKLKRRFVLIEINPEYVKESMKKIFSLLGSEASKDMLLLNCPEVKISFSRNLTNYIETKEDDKNAPK